MKDVFTCDVCGLHYVNVKDAEECTKWCSSHNTCNLDIATRSIEARENRKKY
ncbi:MAG: hypothetical protein M1414_03365 [Candidatus Thermoplasmatota archaeon]|nr:hypothetical protein [Candidatus Thermoplasmatota archaeon]MCL5987928.1 hypothetical protein [Candidatus Thermoplasmatota archaeon]